MKRSIPGLVKLTRRPDNHWPRGTLYVVIAERWSSTDAHSYPVGAYMSLGSALHNANRVCNERGGKYGCRVYATRHPNHRRRARLVPVYVVQSPYLGRAGAGLCLKCGVRLTAER